MASISRKVGGLKNSGPRLVIIPLYKLVIRKKTLPYATERDERKTKKSSETKLFRICKFDLVREIAVRWNQIEVSILLMHQRLKGIGFGPIAFQKVSLSDQNSNRAVELDSKCRATGRVAMGRSTPGRLRRTLGSVYPTPPCNGRCPGC